MSYYLIANLIHILGALGFFIALAIETLSLLLVRRANTIEQIQERMQILNNLQRVGPLSMMLILASGIYMMVTVWGGAAWIIVSLISLILMVGIALTLGAPRMAAIQKALASQQSHATLRHLLNDWILWISIKLRVSLAFGIIFLMVLKPSLAWSLTIIVLGVTISLALNVLKKGAEKTVSAAGK